MVLENARRAVRLAARIYRGEQLSAALNAILSLVYMSGFSAEEMAQFENEVNGVISGTPE